MLWFAASLGTAARRRQTGAGMPLDPGPVLTKECRHKLAGRGIDVTVSAEIAFRPATIWPGRYRSAASASSLFAALLLFAWYYAATLFLIFAGMLLGVALNAMTNLLGRVSGCRMRCGWPSSAWCWRAAVRRRLSRRRHHRQQATVLSDTSSRSSSTSKPSWTATASIPAISISAMPAAAAEDRRRRQRRAPTPHNLPSAGALASSGGAIVSQTLKLLLGTVSAVGNFFIVLFLGLAFAAQPSVYRNGLLFMAPAQASRPRHRHRRPDRRDAGALADRADHHDGRGIRRDLDRACRSSASRARSFWASRLACSPSSRRSAR